jgi:predicted transcriptional regulator
MLRKNLLCTIVENGDSNLDLYKTTEKGKEFLKAYKDLKALMN